jgi:hypothetical protein
MVKWWVLKEDMEYHASEQNRRFSDEAPHSGSEDEVRKEAEE